MIPPGRASSSHATTSTSCGPNQREKCSAFVQTSNTRSRGASNTRVSTTSSAAIASPLLLRTDIPLLLVGGFSALGLELSQIDVEPVEAPFPKTAVRRGPGGDLAQGSRS